MIYIILTSVLIIDLLIFLLILLNRIYQNRKSIMIKKVKNMFSKNSLNYLKQFSPSEKIIKKIIVELLENYHTKNDQFVLSVLDSFNLINKIKKTANKNISKITLDDLKILDFDDKLEITDLIVKKFDAEKKEAKKLQILPILLKRNFSHPDFEKLILYKILGSFKFYPSKYTEKAIYLIVNNFQNLERYISALYERDNPDFLKIIALYCNKKPNLTSKIILMDIIQNYRLYNQDLLDLVETAIVNHFYSEFLDNKSLYMGNTFFKKIIFKSIRKKPTIENINYIVSNLLDLETYDEGIKTLREIVRKNNNFYEYIFIQYKNTGDSFLLKSFALILSDKTDYLVRKFFISDKEERQLISSIFYLLIENNELVNISLFLNTNKNKKFENLILYHLKKKKQSLLQNKNLYQYFNDQILNILGIDKFNNQSIKKQTIEINKKAFSVKILLYSFILPLLLLSYLWLDQNRVAFSFKIFIKDYNFIFIFYSLLSNFFYFFLLFSSFINILKYSSTIRDRGNSFYFQEKMLPGISIIIPAYNEELNIIETVYSLNGLYYPDFEIIVVNDGSSDETLQIIIDHFDFYKIYDEGTGNIPTMPVLGYYCSKQFPRIKLIDKLNGGKADAINTGINFSEKEYMIVIDADTILDSSSLFNVMKQVFVFKNEVPAIGGNILPVNGCKINKGTITKIDIPENALAIFQSVEYARAFMAGRTGWSLYNGLAIISGAFGIFKKDLILENNGYLTSKTILGMDTVGEDMEIVIRLHKLMSEKKRKYKILYNYTANGWTEVPENFNLLFKQRNRWQKGLLEVLCLHKKMIGNPKYRFLGLFTLPYLYFFELVGPIIELQGYLFFFLGLAFSILNHTIILLVFITGILIGSIISLFSLFIIQNNLKFYSLKGILKLSLFSFLENFGFRQIISSWRVFSFFKSFKSKTHWDFIKHRGYKK